MPDYAALLRGVTPMNAKMPELKRCFEAAGFTDVRTVLSSDASDAARARNARYFLRLLLQVRLRMV